ncbi:MAG: hypothetical protein WA594_13830, partial [Candidatus Sulfotelmatobacter sp.]
DFYFLISIRVGSGNPNFNFFASGKILNREGVMKRKVAGILRSGGYKQDETNMPLFFASSAVVLRELCD